MVQGIRLIYSTLDMIGRKTDNQFLIIAWGAIVLFVEYWTSITVRVRVTGEILYFFLFGQQLQLKVQNYIDSKLLPISFQKKIKQKITLHLRSSLLPSYRKRFGIGDVLANFIFFFFYLFSRFFKRFLEDFVSVGR